MAADNLDVPPPVQRFKEFQDQHYHDEDDLGGLPADEAPSALKPPTKSKAAVRLPKRRSFEDD